MKRKHKTGYVPDRGVCSCGKRNYLEHEARKIAKVLTRNTSERLTHYLCPSSKTWHVGHDF